MSTLQKLFLKGSSLLKDLPNPHLEAKILLLECISTSEEQFYSDPDRKLSRFQERCFYKLISKRLAGIPIAYLTGTKEFWSIPFKVFPGVMIPRPETELIVEKVLELFSGREEIVVDIGTGCGNIAISLANELPHARIIATDTSKTALKIAKLNASRQNNERISFLQGSLFSPLRRIGLERKCDLIVSNPPYVSEGEWTQLAVEIRNSEPKKALVAGEIGTEVIQKLIKGACFFLKPEGYLLLEIGKGQRKKVSSFFDSKWKEVRFFSDLYGIDRLAIARSI